MMNVENEKETNGEDDESNEAKALAKRILADRMEKVRNKYKTKTIA